MSQLPKWGGIMLGLAIAVKMGSNNENSPI